MSDKTENCCLLTDLGKQALRDLLNRTYPDGWDGKNRYLADVLTMDRGKTIANIVNFANPQKPDIAVSLRSLECFFQGLFEKLSESQRSEYRKSHPGLDLINPLLKPSDSENSEQKKGPYWIYSSPRKDDPSAKFADLLWTLDYQKQTKLFQKHLENCVNKGDRAIAFSAIAPIAESVEDIPLQEWLLCRLSKSVKSGWQQTATQILLEPPSSSIAAANWGLADICAEVRRVLEDRNIPIYRDNPQDIITALAQYGQQSSVSIVVRHLHRTESGRTTLIKDFWKPLLNQSQSLGRTSRNKKTRMIMFLLEDYDVLRSTGDYICGLSRLELKFQDIEEWFKCPSVRKRLEDRYAKVDTIITEIEQWNCWKDECLKKKHLVALRELSRLFDTNFNLKDISKYWRI